MAAKGKPQAWAKEDIQSIIRDYLEDAGAKVVNKFHNNSDVDRDSDGHHHTLGYQPESAAPGTHNHDGVNGAKIFTPVSVSGSRGSNVALTDLLSKLVTQGLVQDNTSP
jgi:hypothetical protein